MYVRFLFYFLRSVFVFRVDDWLLPTKGNKRKNTLRKERAMEQKAKKNYVKIICFFVRFTWLRWKEGHLCVHKLIHTIRAGPVHALTFVNYIVFSCFQFCRYCFILYFTVRFECLFVCLLARILFTAISEWIF